ncbi:MAG: phosphate ABC transporter permease subunit PstC [Candidatus Nanopelagicales bacterium]|nr:phosphate ABC transporter permease subunit PstC [Candidatus Nanopelagicales bacterium]MDP4825095.1 phosphate ABC transporter permease subunit PstC [Candidatus Nanopelagicales bacterium]
MATITQPPTQEQPLDPDGIAGSSVRRGDRTFLGLSTGSGIFVLVLMAGIAVFLIWQSIPAFTENTANPLTEQSWLPDADPPVFGFAVLFFGTIVTSIIAMLLAVPIGYGIALFIAFYAPARVASILGFLVDLLAAVPSIIFGLWGLYYFMPYVVPAAEWLSQYLGWIPLFANDPEIWTKSILMAGLVLAIMILPTVSAISREVFLQVPRMHVEAALALGATRWEMIRMAVFPFSRPGMISAAMLGLGRALGETIAVALVLSAVFEINWQITAPGGNSFAANIALKWGEAGDVGRSALIASGLVLFFITLIVNMTARWVISRRKDFSGAN